MMHWVWLALGFLILSPLILVIAIVDWVTVWRKGRAPSPFIPEHPDSIAWRHGRPHDARTAWDNDDAQTWAETMERGRRLQAKEDARGD